MTSERARAYRGRVAPLREIDPTGIYHVMSRGNFRQPIHLDEAHYAKKIRLLARVRQKQALDRSRLVPDRRTTITS